MQALLKAYDIGDHSLFGDLKGDKSATKHIEDLWGNWLKGAEVEIRSNFGMESPSKPGAPFEINQGSLQQALASREPMCMKNLKATRWALR